MNFLGRIILFIGGLICALLGLRFLLTLLGANPTNAFANFIYQTSEPFVRPFFGLFNYEPTLGQAHFELSTLIALLVYALLFGLVGRLLIGGERHYY
jgi:YggT family protein